MAFSDFELLARHISKNHNSLAQEILSLHMHTVTKLSILV